MAKPDLVTRIADLEVENARLRHTIRQQGEFILSLKGKISDFLGNA